MLDGSFEDSLGHEATWNVVELHDYSGEVHTGSDAEDYLDVADRVFYEITLEGETYFRWVAGPFETETDLEAAIADEADFYAEAS